MSVTSVSIIEDAARITVETLEVLIDILSSPQSAHQYCDAVGVPPFAFNGEWSTKAKEIRADADAATDPEQWAGVIALASSVIQGIVDVIGQAPGPAPSSVESITTKIVVPVLLEVTKKRSALLHTILAALFFIDQRAQDSMPQGLFAERWLALLGKLASTAGWGTTGANDSDSGSDVDWAPITSDSVALLVVVLTNSILPKAFKNEPTKLPRTRFWYGFDLPKDAVPTQAERLAEHAFTLLIDAPKEEFTSEKFLQPIKAQPPSTPDEPFALTIVPLPKTDGGQSKLYVQVHGQYEIDREMGAGFQFKLTNGSNFGLLVSHDALEPIGDVSFQAELLRESPPPSAESSSPVSFHMDRFSVGARANLNEIMAWLRIENGVLSVLGGTWLDDYVPQLRFTFDVTAEASARDGVHFQGGAGGDVLIPINQRIPILIGSARIESVHVRAFLGEVGGQTVFRIDGAANLTLSLFGVLKLTVDGIGASYSLGTAQGDGNMAGIAHTGWDLVMPHGAGLELKVWEIVGGGAFLYDATNDRLSGTVELQLGDKLSLTGLGIYQRAVGTKPKSWLLLAALTFPPLGAPVSIEGVGLLYGSNRTTDPEAFLAGIVTGDLDAVLFPADPIGHASEYLATLERLFPTAQDASVMGISLKLSAFGRMATLDVGVILDFAASTLVRVYIVAQFVGLLRKPLPGAVIDPEKQAFRVLADGVAVWDRQAHEFNLRITLRNSRVWAAELTGGISIFHGKPEADGGESGTYISIGGFHPDYVPPGTKIFVPPRLALALSKGDHLKLDMRAYVAFTPSSLQVGIAGSLVAQMYGFSIRGLLTLDMLISFDGVFNLHVEFSVELLVGSHSIAAVRFVGSLVGFSRTILAGKAEVKFLFFTLSVHGSLTIHDGDEVDPDADITATMARVIAQPSSWNAGGAPGLMLTDRTRDGVWLSPSEPLRLSQSVVPLNIPIQRFGSVRLREPQTIVIEHVTDDTTILPTTPVPGEFALGMFLDLTQEEMLAQRGFESRDAGVEVTRSMATGAAIDTTDDFEEILVDPQQRPATPPPRLVFENLSIFAFSAALAPVRTPARVRRETFAVVNAALQPLRAGQTYFEARAALTEGLQLIPEGEFAS